ncbi:MAG: LptF/LptG family permease [Rickettsiales bacterium]|nr:LptF/LptG family permease [Rickettsiales bacterium]
MKILSHYFSRRLTLLFTTALLILAGLSWMTQILALMKFIVQYGTDVGSFLGMTMLMFPLIVSVILPYVSFIAVLFAYNQMIGDSEVPVMMGAGLSPAQLAIPALRLTAIIMAFHYCLTLWAIPASQQRLSDVQWNMRYGLANLKIQDSTFTQLANGLVAFVEESSGSTLKNMMISDTRGGNEMVVMGKTGQLIKTDRGITLAMRSGMMQSKSGNLANGTFEEYDMDMNMTESREGAGFRARQIPTIRLFGMEGFDTLNTGQRKKFVSEIGNRLLAPLMNLLLALIALNCLLKTSLLRRAFSISLPLAIFGLIISQSMFMAAMNETGGSISSLYLTAAIQFAAILALFYNLSRSPHNA